MGSTRIHNSKMKEGITKQTHILTNLATGMQAVRDYYLKHTD